MYDKSCGMMLQLVWQLKKIKAVVLIEIKCVFSYLSHEIFYVLNI